MHEEKEKKKGKVPTALFAEIMGVKVPGSMNDCGTEEAERNAEKPQVEAERVTVGKAGATGAIDDSVRQNTIESDRAYRKITEDIISITSRQLEEHNNDKKPLRRDLLDFVKGLLAAQFGALVVFILANNALELEISDEVIRTYIVSVFVETLAGLIIMIKYAFDSTQEVKLIAILSEIIRHFKKYEEK